MFPFDSEFDTDPAGRNNETGDLDFPQGTAARERGDLEAAPMPRWAEDAHSPCYHHTGAPLDPTPFSCTGELLSFLLEANHFERPVGRMLFGLRGCTIAQTQPWTDFVSSIPLAEVVPDHQTPRCVLGVWDPSTGKIGAVIGSTVPDAEHMRDYLRPDGDPKKKNANMLPTGSYRYRVGTHFGQTAVDGVFRLDQKVLPLKSPTDLCYTRTDYWAKIVNPDDNIHPAWLDRRTEGVRFSSAGCQTSPGAYEGATRKHVRLFAQLRQLAGLTNPVPEDQDGRPSFLYVLLTGREARLASTPALRPSLRRLRIGSKGAPVRALQTALGIGVDGNFGPGTMRALLDHQIARSEGRGEGPAGDGMTTKEDIAEFGLVL